MSAARADRRRRMRQWEYEAGRRALAKLPPRYESVNVGGKRAVFVTFEADPRWPESLMDAWRARHAATLTGRCDCGARHDIDAQPGRATVAAMEHEPACLVADRTFTEAVGRWAMGRLS